MANSTLFGALSLGLVFLAGCPTIDNTLNITVGEGEIPPIDGSTSITLPNFTCGDTVTNDTYDITSSQDAAGNCTLHLEGDFEVITAETYTSTPELAQANNALELQKISLSVSEMTLKDNGVLIAPLSNTFNSIDVSILGEPILDLPKIETLNNTQTAVSVDLGDAALAQVSNGIATKQPVSVSSVIDAVIKAGAPIPAQLDITFVAQPEFVIGLKPLVK